MRLVARSLDEPFKVSQSLVRVCRTGNTSQQIAQDVRKHQPFARVSRTALKIGIRLLKIGYSKGGQDFADSRKVEAGGKQQIPDFTCSHICESKIRCGGSGAKTQNSVA